MRIVWILGFLSACLLPAQPGWRVAETWPPAPANVRFDHASSAAVDAQGRLLILQRGQPAVLRFHKNGALEKAWSSGFFQMAHGIKVAPDGNIWTTDARRNVIVKFSPDGKQLQMLGVPDQAASDKTHFDGVADLAFQPNGDFYVADGYRNSRVIKFSRDGRYLFEWGKKGTEAGEFNLPHTIVLDSNGRVYVGDRENKRIQIFTPEGKYITQWRTGAPYGLAMTPSGDLWMADVLAKNVVRLDKDGRVVETIPDMSTHMLAVGPDGALFLAQGSEKRVTKMVRRSQ
ncbi:MAG: hypothetical protein HY235_08625 [Acidobacteria bacterium]|nr:hypothetical protein [Acidobacteriota bacterium]